MRVDVNYEGGWGHPGTLLSQDGDGNWTIQYDDGSKQSFVHPGRVRALEQGQNGGPQQQNGFGQPPTGQPGGAAQGQSFTPKPAPAASVTTMYYVDV